jgi:hypothetical protein
MNGSAQLYLDLLKQSLLGLIYQDPPLRNLVYDPPRRDEPLTVYSAFDVQKRLNGQEWPSQAHTMLSLRRLNNIQTLIENIIRTRTPGDLIETGVWRGGATIFMRGVLKAYGVTDRTVWVADSFEGFPQTELQGAGGQSYSSETIADSRRAAPPKEIQTILDQLWSRTSYEDVREHFARYDLLDDQVQFLRGWFCDTLPTAPIERLALLRLDGDLYDSTYDALKALYPNVSPGGYVIVDDYNTFDECYQAVHDYLNTIGSEPTMQRIDEYSVYWQKDE